MRIFVFSIFRVIDTWWFSAHGYLPDVAKLNSDFANRKFFSKSGLIKHQLSLLPWSEIKLKRAVSRHGGWDYVVKPETEITDKMYQDFESAGYTREQFDHSRRYLSDPKKYIEVARQDRQG